MHGTFIPFFVVGFFFLFECLQISFISQSGLVLLFSNNLQASRTVCLLIYFCLCASYNWITLHLLRSYLNVHQHYRHRIENESVNTKAERQCDKNKRKKVKTKNANTLYCHRSHRFSNLLANFGTVFFSRCCLFLQGNSYRQSI